MNTRGTFLLLCIIGFFAILSSTMSKSPTLPLFARSLGLSDIEIGFVAAASTIVGIVTNITAGALSDIYGRRRLLIASGIFFASAPFMYLLVNNSTQLTLVRAYHGLATAIFTPVSIAVVADLYRESRGLKMGLYSSSTLVGRLVAPSLAGILIAFSGFKLAYIACGVSGVIALALILRMPNMGEGQQKVEAASLRGVLQILSDVRILVVSLVQAVTYYAMQSIETFLPLLLSEMRIEVWIIGLIPTIQMGIIAATKPAMGTLSDKAGRVRSMLLGILLSVMGIVALSMSYNIDLIIVSIVIFSIGVSAITASTAPLVSELTPGERYGSAIGVMETIKDVGQASGPIISGIVSAIFGYKMAFVAVSLILITVIAPVSMLLKRR
ncbi:MAG: MFS transporter [Thermofilum sp. ex4484_79]|nr:MAG: MFS transporter [Thermofilum sp. ex4484_79]